MDKPLIGRELIEFIKEFLPILKKNNKPHSFRNTLFQSANLKDKTNVVALNYSELEIFEKPINYLLKQKQISERYSKTFIRSKITDINHKLIKDESKIKEYIRDLLKELFELPKEYFIISKIENIRILDDLEYEIINSKIKIIQESDLPFKKENLKILGRNFGIINEPCIFTKVMAGDDEKAKEMSLHNFLISFALLKLYAPHFKPFIRGNLLSGNQELIVFNKTKKSLSPHLSRTGNLPLNHAYLNKKFYDELKRKGISELRKDNDISKIAGACLYWWGLGLEEKNPSAKLINFVMVLESSLKRKEEMTELKRAVSERGAILLGKDFTERKKIYRDLNKIYDIRSKIVHTGVLKGDHDFANLAGSYAKEILITLISSSKRLDGNFEKFIEEIDDKKLR